MLSSTDDELLEVIRIRYSPTITSNQIRDIVADIAQKQKVSPEEVLKIIQSEFRRNYIGCVPSAWFLNSEGIDDIDSRLLIPEIDRQALLLRYNADCLRHSVLNAEIPEKPTNAIRFATYNIHGWYDPWNQILNTEEITKVVRKIRPDVLGLQEILLPIHDECDRSKISQNRYELEFQPQSDTLISNIQNRSVKSSDGWESGDVFKDFVDMGFTYAVQCMASLNKSGPNTCFGNLLLSKLPIGYATGLTLEAYQEGRCAIISRIKIGNDAIMVVNTHLDVYDGSGKTRYRQIQHIIKLLDDIFASYPTILMGDLNTLRYDDYTAQERKWLAENNRNNPLDFRVVELLEKAGFRDPFSSQRESIKYSTWSARRVDYQFVRNIDLRRIKTYAYFSAASDHIPLIIDLMI